MLATAASMEPAYKAPSKANAGTDPCGLGGGVHPEWNT